MALETSSRPHDFAASLALSDSFRDAPWWVEVYRKAFPALIGMHAITKDGYGQRGGIDRRLVLSSSKTVTVDEKIRMPGKSGADYNDILLEYLSDRDRNVPGWVAKDLECDFIAYAFVQSRICYMLPFLPLRRAWLSMGEAWIKQGVAKIAGFRLVDAPNRGYFTRSVAVPIPVLMAALREAMIVRWTGAPQEPLPMQEMLI